MESQHTEWKLSWHDEHLKTLCAFANTDGGVLEIGRTDTGAPAGVANAERLLEDLPNKIKNALGIIAAIRLLNEGKGGGVPIIAISISANAYPISCHGKYYIRSGSTTQELTGRALDGFILRCQGRTWDGVPVPNVSIEDFNHDAFNVFRKKALASTRMGEEDLKISNALLLENLRLTDGNYLKRAALLLFHQDPERWFTGAYVKIGYFSNPADLKFQDEVHGALVTMPDKVVDLVYLKYFKGIISYEGIQRIETYPIPRSAFREAVLNAIVHKDYSTGNPIHIHIYPKKVLIYNDGRLPQNWTEKNLFAPHSSKPYNPDIANGFFRAGLIEAWGRGIEKITAACLSGGIKKPYYRIDTTEVMVGFDADIGSGERAGKNEIEEGTKVAASDGIKDGIMDTMKDTAEDTTKETLTEPQAQILAAITANPKITTVELSALLNLNLRNTKKNIAFLKDAGRLRRVGARRNGYWEVLKDVTAEAENGSPKDTMKDIMKDTITGKQAQIRAAITANPRITAVELSALLNLNLRNTKKNIAFLKDAGHLRRVGARRNGYWEVLKDVTTKAENGSTKDTVKTL